MISNGSRESTQISYLRKNHKALVQRSASTHHPDFAVGSSLRHNILKHQD